VLSSGSKIAQHTELHHSTVNELLRLATRSTEGWEPGVFWDFRQGKGLGNDPSPSIWWSWRELNPRPKTFFLADLHV
jgi:hypothetical protein